MILGIIITVLTVLIDQGTKILVSANMEVGDTIVLIKNVFQIHYVRNTGAAYGLFSESRWIFLVISSLVIIALPFFMYRYRRFGKIFIIPIAMVLGGAISNMIDRVFFGSVIDFMEPLFLPFGSFTNNFADIFVNVGAIFLFIYFVFINKEIWKDSKKDKKETPIIESETSDINQVQEENIQIENIEEENENITSN